MPSTTHHDRDRVTEINSQYHDAIADKYEKRFEAFSPEVLGWIRRMFEREVYPALDAFGGKPRVLDVGCGAGYLEEFLVGRDLDLLGLDVSAGMLERAREHYPQWRFEQEDIYALDTNEKYHLVMENAVLHHLVDYEVLIDKMAELTLPGGVLYMGNEPNQYAYRYLQPLAKVWRHTINRYRTADAEERLGDPEFEALSEYHLFYGQGFNPRAIQRRLEEKHGFRRVTIYFSLREFFSAIEEAYPSVKLNRWAPGALRDGFPLSRNFTLIAQR